jgi:hypothetical protein
MFTPEAVPSLPIFYAYFFSNELKIHDFHGTDFKRGWWVQELEPIRVAFSGSFCRIRCFQICQIHTFLGACRWRTERADAGKSLASWFLNNKCALLRNLSIVLKAAGLERIAFKANVDLIDMILLF